MLIFPFIDYILDFECGYNTRIVAADLHATSVYTNLPVVNRSVGEKEWFKSLVSNFSSKLAKRQKKQYRHDIHIKQQMIWRQDELGLIFP